MNRGTEEPSSADSENATDLPKNETEFRKGDKERYRMFDNNLRVGLTSCNHVSLYKLSYTTIPNIQNY